MPKNLKVTIVQPDIIWKNVRGNLDKYTTLLSGAAGKSDLILFPEMFQTGFCTEPASVCETMDGDTVRWMKRTAESMKCALTGSMVIRESRRFFNRVIYMDQYANMTWYDKRHLFRMAGEEVNFTAGLERIIVPLKDWRICIQVCYDLRFPVWSRNRDDYDVLVYLANWPSARMDVWNTLLKARAIENQSYVIGVNRVGTDGNNISYAGESMVIDPKGILADGSPISGEEVKTFSLSWKELHEFRKKFPVLKDRDEFNVVV
jgi:predicted amidohydrolase